MRDPELRTPKIGLLRRTDSKGFQETAETYLETVHNYTFCHTGTLFQRETN
jgi:hypothetical protein